MLTPERLSSFFFSSSSGIAPSFLRHAPIVVLRYLVLGALPAFFQLMSTSRLMGQSAESSPPVGYDAFAHLGFPPLDVFLDSLAAAATATDLEAISQRWDPRQHVLPKSMGHLRLGFHQLRQGQLLGGREWFDAALSTFSVGATDEPSMPHAWYAVGIANLELRRRDIPDPAVAQKHMTSYLRYYLGARQAFENSLYADSMFTPTLAVLEALVAQEGDRGQPQWVIDALGRYDSVRPSATLALVLGRQSRAVGEYERAIGQFHAYAALGGDTGVSSLELARSLAALRMWDEAVQSYWTGAQSLGDEGWWLYRSDLAWIATQVELEDFDRRAIPPETWLRSFWRVRDLESLRPPGSRLKEHLRRWTIAHRDFRVTRPETRAVFNPPLVTSVGTCATGVLVLDEVQFINNSRPTDLRSWEPFLDQRAVLYMRHGEPLRRTWSSRSGRSAEEDGQRAIDQRSMLRDTTGRRIFETWSYWIDGEPRLFFFSGSSAFGPGPTTLRSEIPSRALLAALESNATLDGDLAGEYRRDLARLRHDLEAREAGLSRALPSPRCTSSYRRWKVWTENGIKTAVKTDGHILIYRENLMPRVQVFGLPGSIDSANGTVLVAINVPSRYADPDSVHATDTISLRVRMSGVEVRSKDGFWLDTTTTLHLTPKRDSRSLVSGLVEKSVPPGEYRIHVAVALADSSRGNSINLPGTTNVWSQTDTLRISDIIAGGGSDNLLWEGIGAPVGVNPLAIFGQADTVELYYVIGGLRSDELYQTDIAVVEMGENEEFLSFSFRESAVQPVEHKRRGLSLESLRPGNYVLSVTIREESSGRSVHQSRSITVVE